MSAQIDARAVALDWLSRFGNGLSSADVAETVSCFLPHGWLRNIIVFTWDNRSLEGHEKITDYLVPTLSSARITDVRLDDRDGLQPTVKPIKPDALGVVAGFTFSTPIAHGQGYLQLLPDSSSGCWKALSVMMMASDLKGHEEARNEQGMYGGHTLAWEDVLSERHTHIEEQPYALIIGAGQTGLNVAARFKQMNIPTIVIERNNRIGDSWRKRYPTLTLHTVKKHSSMLYQSYPTAWPTYTPRTKLADWLEQYARSLDLVVWTNSELLPTPTYDENTKRWTATVNKNGVLTTIHPSHILSATGALGSPYTPTIPDIDIFQGTTLHSSSYQGGKPFAGKRVLVVGSGNTSADVCQDLYHRGAASVTMLQRSATCIISLSTTRALLEQIWREDLPNEICDLTLAATPIGLLRKLMIEREQEMWDLSRDMYDGLRKAGMALNMGKDGSGQFVLTFERFGGYFIDVGCADLIISGKVKIKHGVEIVRFTKDGVIFTDGSTLDTDVVIFATGYYNMRDEMKKIFDTETLSRTSEIWGLDGEDELKGNYRPTGHPGLWFAAGDFYMSRFYSKSLAVMIKAIELGVWDGNKPASAPLKN